MEFQERLKAMRESVFTRPKGITFSFTLEEFPEIEKLVLEELGEKNLRFLEKEWNDWLKGTKLNPGKPYLEDKERWLPYLNEDKRFDYRYPERLRNSLHIGRKLLKKNPKSRRVYLSVWDGSKDFPGEGKVMVPCILGYHFYITGNVLRLNVMVRSLNVAYGGQVLNDMWLAAKLLQFMLRDFPMLDGNVYFLVSNAHISCWREE